MKKSIYLVLSLLVGCGGGNEFTSKTDGVVKPNFDAGETGGSTSANSDPVAGNSSNDATGGSVTNETGGSAASQSSTGGGSSTQATGGSTTLGTGGSNPSGTGGSQATGGAACSSLLTLDYIKTTYACDTSNPIAYGDQLTQPSSSAFLIQDKTNGARYWCTDHRSEPNCTKDDSGTYVIYNCFSGICGSKMPCNKSNSSLPLCPSNVCNTTSNKCPITNESCSASSNCASITCDGTYCLLK